MNCVNIKPCNRVVYSLINPSRIPEPPPKPGQPHMPQLANLAIQFENTEVGNIYEAFSADVYFLGVCF